MIKPLFRIKHNVIVACMVSFAFVGAVPAMADLGKLMDGMYSATTRPGVYESQQRMGYIGGSYSIRTSIKPINIISIDPPRFSAGCGGIDAFAGAFSFINMDQIVALMRQVAQNAAGLLFKMAIDVINPMLGARIAEFAQKIQDMVNSLKNTCAVAQGAINLFANPDKSLAKSVDDTIKSASTALSETKDSFTAMFTKGWEGLGDRISRLTGAGSGAPVNPGLGDFLKNYNLGNVVWRSIVRSKSYQVIVPDANVGAGMAFTADDQKNAAMLIQMVMGTQIIDAKNQNSGDCWSAPTSPTAPKCDPKSNSISGHTLTVDMLIDPADIMVATCKAGDDAITGNTDDDQYKCQDITAFRPMKEIWPGTKFIVDKGLNLMIRSIQEGKVLSSYTDADGKKEAMMVLAMTPAPVYSHMLKVQRSPEAVALVKEMVGSDLSEQIAIQLGRDLVKAVKTTRNAGKPVEGVRFPETLDANVNAFIQSLDTRQPKSVEMLMKVHYTNMILETVWGHQMFFKPPNFPLN